MAATVVTGTVNWVKVSAASDLASFQVAIGGTVESFILWWSGSTRGDPTTTQRLLWTSELSLLRDALIHNLTVSVTIDDTGGVLNVQLNHA